MIIYGIVGLGIFLLVATIITNPFSRLSIVYRPYIARYDKDAIISVNNNHKIIIRNNIFWRLFAWIKSGIHVLQSRYLYSPRSKSNKLNGIIKDIHKLRFNPRKLLLISGDHFTSLYPRNLGVFYYPTLDGSIASSEKDWDDRQLVYLQTLAFALGVFAKRDQLATTLVPTGRHSVTCINCYAYPSDSLYGILYASAVLKGLESAQPYSYGQTIHMIKSHETADDLLEEYKTSLQSLYIKYKDKVFDEKTGLINLHVQLSGAKDITKRRSAFYDNVIFWKTTELAQRLHLIKDDKQWLNAYKKRILQKFWLQREGYFLEDLSDEGIKNKYYSSDWLVVLFTKFLNPENSVEVTYFTRLVDYIERHGIDKPFAIKYQQDRRARRQFLIVRLAIASYGGNSIWSFWGMEYIKVLLMLYKLTKDTNYLIKADFHIDKYKKAMVLNGGFPEVYDDKGLLLQSPFYRSIRQTGWVIGFEQVLSIRATML